MNGIENLAPVPLPGECIYSIAAAFAQRWFRAKRQGAVLLFGGAAPCARDVPARLRQLESNLPATLGLTAERLALQHTVLPIHFPFLEGRRRDQLLHDAIAGKAMQLKLGLAPSRLVCSRALRLCPRCLEHDEITHGRAYWHREHQLAGALVCPWHDIPLCVTSVRPESVYGRVIFVSPRKARIIAKEPVFTHQIACRVSQALAALLKPGVPWPGLARLHACYRQKLLAAGYSQPNHSIAISRLRSDMLAFYGDRFLRHLACIIPQGYGWLAALLRKPRNHVQPLRHVLLMTFIGTPTELLVDALKIEPISSGSREHPFRIKNPQRLKMLLPIKRRAWLQVLKSSSDGSRDSEGALYGWLWRNDRRWLAQHRKASPQRTPNLRVWAKRDMLLAARIPRVAKKIERLRPWRRASRSVIATYCGAAAWLVRDHPHLPCAVTAIKAATETSTAYAVRRLNALARDRRLRLAPAWKLRVRAGISVSVAKRRLVAQTLRAITSSLAHAPL